LQLGRWACPRFSFPKFNHRRCLAPRILRDQERGQARLPNLQITVRAFGSS
jgi:hypothetical protein